MDMIKGSSARYTSRNQAILDGLFSGFWAGTGMALFMVIFGLTNGQMPGSVMAQFSMAADSGLLSGVLTHLAVSGVYGLVFGLLDYFLFQHFFKMSRLWRGIILGGIYGILLWLFAAGFLVSSSSPMLQFPASVLAVAHLIYGITLGVLMNRPGSS